MEEKFMKMAIEESKANSVNNYNAGGPFGAVIVKNGEIISQAHNTVIENQDPTAHAEVNAIRLAAKKLGTHDLSNCIVYTSAEPCPMCLSAIIWANIKEVFYANTKEEVDEIGFRDEDIYDYLKGKNNKFIKLKQIDSEEAEEVFDDFVEINEKKMY